MAHKNVIAYCRVSTTDQDTARQEAELTAWAERQGWNLLAVVTETASGTKHDRARRSELITIAKKPSLTSVHMKSLSEHQASASLQPVQIKVNELQGKLDAIIVTEASRWSRSLVDHVTTLHELASAGVSVLAINGMSMDVTTPHGKMMTSVLGALAEFERDLMVERIKSGQALARSKGEHIGRKPGSLSADVWKHRSTIVRMLAEGKSAKDIQTKTGLSRASYYRVRRDILAN